MGEPLTLTVSVENHRLKEKSEEELLAFIIESNTWNDKEAHLITSAYELAKSLHVEDEYKGQPYIYHSLRTAARIVGYLNIHDAEVVAAALLHDTVEDHAEKIANTNPNSPHLLKQEALEVLAATFTQRTAELVATVTNDPLPESLSEGEKIAIYIAKVRQATSTPEGWIIKFSDWCENGVGIIHSSQLLSSDEISHFQRKYGGEVLETYDKRFRERDINTCLDWAAKGYVEYQLEQGRQRLYTSEHS